MTQANNIAVTLGWLVGSYKIANAEEMIVKSLKAQVKDLPKDGVLDLWYDMTNRKAKLNAGDWCSGAEIDAWKTALIEHAAVDTAADIEIMDEAGGPGDGDWVKIASAVGTDIRDSAISGKGLFATRSFSTGDVLVTDFMQKQNTDDPRTRWEQSDSCRYTNHSDKPNAFIRKLGETVELVADETIQPNEEITCNYRDASKTLGKAFFYTYRGKPYGNDTSAAAFMQKTAATLPDTFYGLPTFLKQAQTTDDILDRIANARSQTATEVSAGNAAAGNYRKGRFNYHGLRISIENPKGSVRSGTAADGTKWSNEMKSDYGYIRGTIGADGDPVDVFIGDDPKSELVFIVNQVNKSGSFDEHKVVLGVIDAKQARQTYLANYKPGWTGAGSVIGMTMQQFKDWLQSGAVNKPAVTVKQAGDLGTPKLPPVPELPWRDRVEVFARKPVTGEIYGGRWDADKSFALPGGGIDPGEDAATAAMREFMEETGIPISNARKLDVPSVDNPWSDEHRQRTGRNFAGARTHFVQADIAGEQAPGKLDVWNAGERGYYSPEAALQMMLANTNYMAPASAQRRIEILQGMQPQPAGEVKQASTQMDAAAKLRALLIEGNPDRPGEPERMHTSLTQLLQSLGYDVQRTPSVEYSDVPDADVAIGFSRGADRLRFSKAPVRIAVGSGGSLDGVPRVNHPRDRVNLSNPDEFNTLPVNVQRAHSTLTKGMRSQLTDLIPAVTVKQSMHHGSHIQGLKAIQPGPSRVLEGDSAVGMTMQQFKSWLRGDVTKPAESIKQAADLGIPELPQPKRTRVVMPYDDGYLLERMNNPKYPANLGRQRFPGGGIDAGETSQQAAAREMMEELGLSVKPEQLRSLGIHANADHGPEEYFELADHGIQPGNYTASIGGDKHIELIKGLLNSPHYWGAQLNTLQQPNPTTGAVKQAGNPLAAFGKVLKRTATTASRVPVPKVVRNAVLPTVKPNPALVAANSAAKTAPPVVARPAAAARTVARPQPAAARGMRAPVRNVAAAPVPHPTVAAVTGKLRGVRDTVANVPKGEAFSQRPIANTSRLAMLDGVPGMRLVNRAALGAAGYTAGSHLLDANNAVNGAIDTSATQLGDYFDATPEQRAGFSDDLYNAKWNVLQDQTLGAAGRGVKSLFGGKRDDRVAAQDAAMRAAAMEAVRRSVHAPEDGAAKPSLLRRVLANRSPVAVAAASAPTLMQQLVDKPSTLSATGRVVDNIRRSGVDVNNPTAVEQALRDNFGNMYSRLTPQQLNKLRRDIAIGTAVGATVLR